MKDATPQPIYLKDYVAPDYLIKTIDLVFELDDTRTQVYSTMKLIRQVDNTNTSLKLNGENLILKSIKIDGELLAEDRYEEEEEFLTLHHLPQEFTLEIHNEINPEENKALDGLYKSGNIFCSQNEPEGFRRITYYLDRPDVMAKFTTKIIGDKKLYPILLSNGNPIDSGDLEGGKHFVTWEDPFKKPAYLYALVAGDLGEVKDTYTTMSGREIDLRIYCDKGNEDKCGHAMLSLKNSMKWDEDTFGLEYDLDIYMIVAVDSFNMGAMENKGLNIFNSAYVLAKQDTASDNDYLGIEGVVGHEYFHNWTGNRITCRDWFQLTLKEGLTVYRDQEFSADMNQRTVKRIEDVAGLRGHQFVEDAGPTGHPIKPSSYIEMNNFYTATVYEKGSEVIRMIRTFLGKEGFRKGMDKYFELFDGQAVTTEDFLHAMSVANNNFDFTQFKNWYSQAGTPVLKIESSYHSEKQELTLKVSQSCPATPEADIKKPFHMPLGLGLLARDGQDIPLVLNGNHSQPQLEEGILHLTKKSEEFVFKNVNESPILSVNRGFMAPVKIEMEQSFANLAFIMANDNDEFNRFEAGQILAKETIKGFVETDKTEWSIDAIYLEAYGSLLSDETLDDSFKALCMEIPEESILHQMFDVIDFQKVHDAREFLLNTLSSKYEKAFIHLYESKKDEGEFKVDAPSIGRRSLKNTCLRRMSATQKDEILAICEQQFNNATNMTDEISALGNIIFDFPQKAATAVNKFYQKWKHETLVMQKWLGIQAAAADDSTYERVLELEKTDVYDKTVPNLFRSLWGAFSRNYVQFHHPTGRGYKLVADRVIELDKLNPQIASRIVGAYRDYKKLMPGQKTLMKTEIDRILGTKDLSKNTYEIISKIAGDQ